ncbi:MAG: hypothetical protein V3V14_01630 [Saprospiraceae bacterium]
MKSSNYFGLVLLLLSIVGIGCSDITDLNDLEREKKDVEIAIPLINTQFRLSDFVDNEDIGDNVSIKIDAQDRVTIVYNGDVVKQTKEVIFPSIPYFPVLLSDTLFSVPVPFATDQKIDFAIFGPTNLLFKFISQFEENVKVEITIPQLSLDGEIFSYSVHIPYEGTSPIEFTTDSISIEGWKLESSTNKITINYDARLPNGDRVRFNGAGLIFSPVSFDYVEGYFGNDVFDINGDFIPVGYLSNWKSGGLSFVDPKINIYVENSFGFPVRSIFNKMQIETTIGEVVVMESDIINTNVDFNYPKLNEVGQSKITEFSFTKENSNIVELFKEKVSKVTYDIDALANPDGDDSIIGFVDEEGYFLVHVDVELPLHGTVNNLVLQDTIDLDFSEFNDILSAEFKNVITNDFPADITLQGYVIDQSNTIIDSLFEGGFILPSAMIDSNGKSIPAEEVVTFEDYNNERFSNLKNGKRILMTIKINTGQASSSPLWIYNNYGVKLKIGAKMVTSNK